jgi:tripartite-type tricarboxylate transporter receptor subunit TctC
VLLTVVGIVGGTGGAVAQDFPSKPIRFIVPSSAGTTSDLLARVLGAEMSKILGQPIVVEDKPGANQIIALEHIAKQSPADGYTVGIVGVDGVALLPLTNKDLRFDPLKDLFFVAGVAETRYVLAGPAARPWKTFQELIAYAKANPGKLNYGSSVHQVRLPVLVLIRELGLNMVHIPYSGGGPYLQAVASGTVDLGITGEAAGLALGNKVQFFAITGRERSPRHPDVPTFAELNFPQINGPSYALSVRAGTPKPIIDKLSAAASTALERPEVKAALANHSMDITNDKPDAAARKLSELARFYADLAAKVSLTSE